MFFSISSSSFITQVRHYSLVLFIHWSLLKEIFVQSFYLLFQTSIQSLLNNSVFVKGTMAIYIWRKQWHVLSFYLLIRELCHFFFQFFFSFFFGFFFLLLCIILLNFNSCLLLFFFSFFFDRLIDRRLYKTGRCLANSRYLLCFFFFFFR